MQSHVASAPDTSALASSPTATKSKIDDMLDRDIAKIQEREPCIKMKVRHRYGLSDQKLSSVLMHARGGSPDKARKILMEAWDDLQNLTQVRQVH